MAPDLERCIQDQRKALEDLLAPVLTPLANQCAAVWPDREALNQTLRKAIRNLPYCSFMYVTDTAGIQVSDNISTRGLHPEHFRRDRSGRPYLQSVYPAVDILLSEAYVSLIGQRPSITAIHLVRHGNKVIGLLGADFDLRNLPLTQELYEEPSNWRQIKGDPAIRGQVFLQSRVASILDAHINDVLPIMEELMTEHGVFHSKLLFSSSRATIWLLRDPYRYRILDVESLIDPDVCLAYPRCPYPEDALVPRTAIKAIFESFRELRYADDTIYLRAGSLNIFNGMVALNFSCDGSHYLRYDEFLQRDNAFWAENVGTAVRPAG